LEDKPETEDRERSAEDLPPGPPGDEVGGPAEPTGIVQQEEAGEEQRRPAEHRHSRDLLDWITIALLLAAVVVYGWQARSLSKQVAALEETVKLTRNDQRAWVGVARIDGSSDDALDLGAKAYIGNFGKSPALRLEQKLNNRLMPREEAFAPDYRGASRGSIGVLFPGGEQIGFFPSHKWKPEEVAAVKANTSILYRYGEITYYDVFDEVHPHKTTFCDRLVYSDSAPVGWGWEVNDTYNTAD
jgi:hypothetical protein